ncbi:4-hydroxy-2-oxovalerate aldolase [Sedimentibacter hydroxybenzoicus DSM 7310]|uniref:4-hydroxy-2-oxovalerate aldolase n=1 Tax=Sedimentibacter hydroxybenzoicus DSM 7310 TaxID=1123245 RepID=A0A974BLA2_SEDHY|nr:4-hydroxy-2-oxovalerate aldolase [Sedimentibacter hydroxybenzoicus]NYB75058.1 4-hydroxy-2-oxovalerate aldolase [Sedimentibacter hydroxybenzoicus DSM 7310]
MSKIYITDTTLRDGSHTVSHKFSPEDVKKIASSLDAAGIDIIEVGHGDGLTGSTINYGFSPYNDFELVRAAASVVKNSKLAVLLIPGIGTVEDLERAQDCGANAVRVATHVTEADVAAQHVRAAKKMGLFTVGFLMMAHMASVERVLEEAKKFESYGADIVYCTDSAGAMLPVDVRDKISTLVQNLSIPVGHHSHNNLGLAIGNSLAAIESGATYIDGSLSGLGAGSGNTSTDTLVAVMKKMNYDINADLYKTMDASTNALIPVLESKGLKTNTNLDAMILGYAGCYSSFLLHSRRAAERFNVDVRDIIIELGNRKAVGGQEDWIIEVASDLSKLKNK